ncbi:MAG: hypothetical protein IJE02_01630 [Clostridia bacterium]|nr:hypothetical protein [Clostridia bacterium]
MNTELYISNDNREELLCLSVRLKKIWRNSAIIWTIMDYAFTILSFITSVIVIFLQTSNFDDNKITLYTIILTSISSTFIVVSFCINPRKHKMVYRKAFDIINTAILATYLSTDDKVYLNLAKSIKNGEKIISTSLEVEVYDDSAAENFINDLVTTRQNKRRRKFKRRTRDNQGQFDTTEKEARQEIKTED